MKSGKAKFAVGLITFPLGKAEGRHILVKNFLQVLEPSASDIYIITGNYPESADVSPKIHLTNVRWNNTGHLLVVACRYMVMQLKLSYHLARVASKVGGIIFYVGSTSLLLPMLTAKLLRKRTLLIPTGSHSKNAEQMFKGTLFGAGGLIAYHLFGTLEHLTCSLADKIVLSVLGNTSIAERSKHRRKVITDNAGAPTACPLFVDTNLIKSSRDVPNRKNLVGYIGRLSKEKGITNFVESIPLILSRRSDVEFLIGGDGPLFSEIERTLMDSNLGARVRLTGWIPHDEIPDYLNQLKLIIIPSYSEGLPVLMLEAMACHTPVLATPVGSIPDIITDDKTGFITEDNSPECITNNVIRALNHGNLGEIAKNARTLVETQYSYDAAIREYQAVLAELLGADRP